MNPAGPLAVALGVGFLLAVRWRALRGAGAYTARSQGGDVLLGLAAIALSVGVTVAGRWALLALTPLVLIPAGIYLVRKSRDIPNVGGLDLHRAGWTSIVTGLLGVLALGASLVTRG